MSRDTVLIIEDDDDIADLASLYLDREGFKVVRAADGGNGLAQLEKHNCRLIVLDLMLPDIDGFEICKQVRKSSDIPIIMLTAKDSEIDKIVGLEIGADDYMTKPFSPRELAARVKAVLRRGAGDRQKPKVINLGKVIIDADRRTVTAGKKNIPLTAKEFDLLYYLALNKSLVMTREQLLAAVWSYDYAGDTRTVDVHVNQLRSKLGAACPITTVWGVGYKIDAEL